jgi:general secretion pathway protein G
MSLYPARTLHNRRASLGLTAIELLMVVVIAGIVGTMATTSYRKYAVRAQNASAIGDLGRIKLVIDAYRLNNDDRAPANLAEIKLDSLVDPWGQPYVYFNFSGSKGNGGKRKDRNLVPINSAYDLYSKGPDKASASPLTAKASRDDIIMANDGKYIGVAEDY